MDYLIDEVVRIYGHEDPKTIGFCCMVERYRHGEKYLAGHIYSLYSEITREIEE